VFKRQTSRHPRNNARRANVAVSRFLHHLGSPSFRRLSEFAAANSDSRRDHGLQLQTLRRIKARVCHAPSVTPPVFPDRPSAAPRLKTPLSTPRSLRPVNTKFLDRIESRRQSTLIAAISRNERYPCLPP
jgi:hypothetical protein